MIDPSEVFSFTRTKEQFDFKGAEVAKMIINGENISEIRGSENVKDFVFKNGASEKIIIFN